MASQTYQILIQNSPRTNLDWFCIGNPPRIWKTQSYAELANKYLDLVKFIATDRLIPVEIMPIQLTLSTDPHYYVDITGFNIVNNGVTFHIDFEIGLKSGVVFAFDQEQVDLLLAALEDVGLTNISLTPWGGLNAMNPTGQPISATYELQEGFLKIIDSKTQNSDYLSKSYTINF